MKVIVINILPVNKNGLRYGGEFWPLGPKSVHCAGPHVDGWEGALLFTGLLCPSNLLFFLLKIYLFLLRAYKWCFPSMYAFTPRVCSALRGQKKALEPLQLPVKQPDECWCPQITGLASARAPRAPPRGSPQRRPTVHGLASGVWRVHDLVVFAPM